LLRDAQTLATKTKGQESEGRRGQDSRANAIYLLRAIVDSRRIALQKLLLDKSVPHTQAK
jgi:hypothetical protein